jgi:hypothetical protein
MEEAWRKIDGTKIENLADYISEYLKRDGDFQLFIGTDSQRIRKRNVVLYAKVICIYNVGKGAHVIYSKTKRSDVRDISTRLWWEIEYSMEIANYLRENSEKVLLDEKLTSIHVDISPKLENKSNSIFQAAVGYIKGMGFICKTKPDAIAASYAADLIVRS